jgi:hypothetical protein
MKKLASTLFVLALVLGFATSSFAQAVPAAKSGPTLATTFAPYVEGSISTAPGAPGENYSVGVGLEHNSSRFYFDGNGSYNSALVTTSPNNGHIGQLKLQGYYKIGGHLLAGVGATASINTVGYRAPNFANDVRATANPFVGTGLEFGRFRTIATYQIPIRGNGAIPEQIKFSVSNEFALTRHIRLTLPITINSYREGTSFPSDVRVTVTQVGGGIKFVL